ncbi:MAG: hypothetical protein IJ661_10460 [Lachnospiraceae bacterium]|nr:hypothetical protein [Lachnospiraceae bacterium]
MTDQEARKELERIVKEEYPLIASEYIDQEVMLLAAKKINYEVTEWRGVNFPYRRLNEDFMEFIKLQFLTTSNYDIFDKIGEEKVIDFLNKYYYWELFERDKLYKELSKNKFDLTEADEKDFEQFKEQKPVPCKETLDIEGYLHMLRIAYDAAPKLVYPDFASDLYVVAHAKFDSCRLYEKNIHEKMEVGDNCPMFMHYHPEEMGFGGPLVRFEWEDDGWIMYFTGKNNRNGSKEVNKDIHRFLAMRRAGYPVIYRQKS